MSRRRTNHRAAEPSADRSASASAVRQSFAVKVVAPSFAALLVSAWERQPRRRDWRENGARSASRIKRDIPHPKPRSRSYRRFRGFCAIVDAPPQVAVRSKSVLPPLKGFGGEASAPQPARWHKNSWKCIIRPFAERPRRPNLHRRAGKKRETNQRIRPAK